MTGNNKSSYSGETNEKPLAIFHPISNTPVSYHHISKLYSARGRKVRIMKRLLLVALFCTACSKQPVVKDQIVENYIKHQSPVPVQMATAIRSVPKKHQKTLQAISIVESNGTPWAVGKSGEKGAFQVIEKDWGKVSQHPDEQAKQAQRILDELLEASKGNELKALAMYNGGSRPNKKAWKYAYKVIKVKKSLS